MCVRLSSCFINLFRSLRLRCLFKQCSFVCVLSSFLESASDVVATISHFPENTGFESIRKMKILRLYCNISIEDNFLRPDGSPKSEQVK